jgi:hypothetical protein
MKEASSEPPNIDGSHSVAQPPAPSAQALNEHPQQQEFNEKTHPNQQNGTSDSVGGSGPQPTSHSNSMLKIPSTGDVPSHTSSQIARSGSLIETPNKAEEPSQEENSSSSTASKKKGFVAEVKRSVRIAVTYSWLNVFLIFVPVGIAVAQIDGINGAIVFGLNAVAIIPLAGLLAFATESVARKMGDALGALLNVTFGKSTQNSTTLLSLDIMSFYIILFLSYRLFI